MKFTLMVKTDNILAALANRKDSFINTFETTFCKILRKSKNFLQLSKTQKLQAISTRENSSVAKNLCQWKLETFKTCAKL